MKKEKYRIVECHQKFYVEVLVKILFWSYYTEIIESGTTDEYGLGGDIKFFDTLEDAKKFVQGCELKYHKI